MRKIKVLQQVLDPSGLGGVSSEYRALKQSVLAEEYEFIPMVLMHVHRGINCKDIAFYYKTIKKEQPDIIHVRGAAVDGLNAIIAAKVARRGRIFVAVHGMYSDLVFINPIKRWISKNVIERLTFKMSDGISCVCKYAENRKCFDLYRNKMLPFVYNRMPIFDSTKRLEYRSLLRRQYEIPMTALVALYVGRITREKGIGVLKDSLLNMYPKWPNGLIVLVVGDGDYLDRFMIECSKITDRVIFAGVQSDVEKFYAASDFFILPSLHENHSISLLESVAARIPAIATDCGGNSEIVVNDETGIIIPVNDSSALEKAIIRMCDNDYRGSLVRSIISHDYSCFSDDVIDRRLDEAYKLILNK